MRRQERRSDGDGGVDSPGPSRYDSTYQRVLRHNLESKTLTLQMMCAGLDAAQMARRSVEPL